ncbi:MAG: zf-HC2 domain-containing protein [Clostridiaceae bacterium]|nr:zf-HC2 domain-containing protein [Clostridiaceae bacterium]
MIPCEDREENIARYVAGTLDSTAKTELLLHIAGCPRCRAELALALQLAHMLDACQAEIPHKVLTAVQHEIEAADEKKDVLSRLWEARDIIFDTLALSGKALKLAINLI